MNKLILLVLCVLVTGCLTEARGNAAYEITCPFILPDGSVATYEDENGDLQPVMTTITIRSGRNLAGGGKLEIPGCIVVRVPKLEQGEDRSKGIVTTFGTIGKLLLKLIF